MTEQSSLSQSVIGTNRPSGRDGTPKRTNKSELHRTRQIEQALAISIILSNLSNDEEYIKVLLGVDKWKEAWLKENGCDASDKSMGGDDFQDWNNYDEDWILGQPGVIRITGMFNLLSHPEPFISEQISILLANVSNSPYFNYQFLSDRCMKSIIKILRFKSRSTQTEVSLLAILITILNLSAIHDVVQGIENMNFLDSLEFILQNEAKPLEQRSIALMAISNIFTQSKDVEIKEDSREFAFRILEEWKHMRDNEGQNEEVIKNLVYASLTLFYNLLLKDFTKGDFNVKNQNRNIMKKLILCLNDHIMDDFDEHMIVNVVLHLITLFTKNEETAQILFGNSKILEYIFNKLSTTGNVLNDYQLKQGVRQSLHVRETIRLATLALSRLSSKFDRNRVTDQNYI